MTRWQWLLSQLLRKLWLRASAYALLGILTALIAIGAQQYLPWKIPELVGAGAVERLLDIIASSMLAVTTFSLTAMTGAYSAAATGVTPRATSLLVEDTVSHRVLSTFVGSFLFSIVGIIVLKTGAYGPSGRSVLFVMTIVVLVLIVVNLLHWIDHLTRLGRMGETTDRVEAATKDAMAARLEAPYLGGMRLLPAKRDIPAGALIVRPSGIGHLQHIDMFALSAVADEQERDIHVLFNPGGFVSGDRPLAWMEMVPDAEKVAEEICAAFTVGVARRFDQDPRFGLSVMSEIGLRVLPPAANDPGTVLDVIGRNTRLLAFWADGQEGRDEIEPAHPRIHIARLEDEDLFEDAFMLMARDAANMIEVQLRLQKALGALAQKGPETFRAAARHQAEMALERAEAVMSFPQDLERLRKLARYEQRPRGPDA